MIHAKSYRTGRALVLTSVLIAIVCGCGKAPITISRHDSGEWGPYELWAPASPAQRLIFFFSDAGGFEEKDRDAARALVKLGAAVALVNTGTYLSRIDRSPDPAECLYLPGAVEWTSHYLQQHLGFQAYRRPLLLGRGLGGDIVYALLAQGSSASFAGGLSVDFSPALSLRHPLCGCTAVTRSPDSQVLDPASHLCGWWHVGGTKKPPRETVTYVRAAAAANTAVSREIAVPEVFLEVVEQTFASAFKEAPASSPPPIADAVIEVSDTSTQKTLAVVFSGDGGWREIDRCLGDYLARKGMAVIGINCLSYFWQKRSPEEAGRDLAWLLRRYMPYRSAERAVLIGYSFGADILPAAYNRLPADVKSKVAQISLLAPDRKADFEFRFSGWVTKGASASAAAVPLPPEIAKINRQLIQCFYGSEETDESLCTDACMAGAEITAAPGGHHFNGSYEAIGEKILAGAKHRLTKRAQFQNLQPSTVQ